MTDPRARPKPIDGASDSKPAVDFATLYRSELPYVWKTLRRLGAPTADLEDLVHDVFVVVHRHLADYDPTRPLRPWLFGIALRVVSDFRRLGRNLREIPGPAPEPVAADPSPEQRLQGKEARDLLMKALEELDLDRRAVFVLHELDEQGMPEIATTLSIPLNTAYSRLRLARADVAAFVARSRARGRMP